MRLLARLLQTWNVILRWNSFHPLLMLDTFLHSVLHFNPCLFSEWGGHWSHPEFIFGAGIWVSFVISVFGLEHWSCLLILENLISHNGAYLMYNYNSFGRYMTGKLLLKLDTVKFIVANHTVNPDLRCLSFTFTALIWKSWVSCLKSSHLECLFSEGALPISRRV